MILRGMRWAEDEGHWREGDLEIADGTIHCSAGGGGRESLDLSGLLLLPGLINAHDHLEFNLFPKLGRRTYSNLADWASDIHRPNDSPVKEHAAVPMHVRLRWGGIRNLLSGVTTVAHHNPYAADPFDRNFPVRVIREFGWVHSLAFSSDIAARFHATPTQWPFILHAAEGRDEDARSEIERLEKIGALAPNTVLVHANAAGEAELKLLRRRGTSIIWCPRSNLATYARTLRAGVLQSGIGVALGTDSAITSPGDLIDEIHTAVTECDCPPHSVYRMVTAEAARVLRLNRGQGFLREAGVADIVAVADRGQSPAEALLNLRPEFVMIAGRFRLASESMAMTKLSAFTRNFQPIEVESRGRYFIDADVQSLHREAAVSIGPKLRLAGRGVAVGAAT
jgi:cytosine/adenosine deaminase-related metal-dependent hydrolase